MRRHQKKDGIRVQNGDVLFCFWRNSWYGLNFARCNWRIYDRRSLWKTHLANANSYPLCRQRVFAISIPMMPWNTLFITAVHWAGTTTSASATHQNYMILPTAYPTRISITISVQQSEPGSIFVDGMLMSSNCSKEVHLCQQLIQPGSRRIHRL